MDEETTPADKEAAPWNAILARLASIKPFGGSTWSDLAMRWLVNLRYEVSDVAELDRIGTGYRLTWDDGTTDEVSSAREVRNLAALRRAAASGAER